MCFFFNFFTKLFDYKTNSLGIKGTEKKSLKARFRMRVHRVRFSYFLFLFAFLFLIALHLGLRL